MTIEYKIDDGKIEKISAAFGIKKDSVERLYKEYCSFSPYLEGQFLAHFMRGIECYFRKKTKNDRFIVICEPYKQFYPGQKQASAYYYPPKSAAIRLYDKTNGSFIINYDKNLPEKELRDYISHEIGHLLWEAILKKTIDFCPPIEPLSSIFGIFIMSEKNDFYANYDLTTRNHKDWQDLLDCFLKIHREQK